MYVKVMNQFLLILLVLLISTSVAFSKSEEQAAECASEAKGPCHNKQLALKYSYIAIGTILVASIIGVSLPLFAPAVPAFQPDRSPFLLVRSFASGVIVATGFMHVMPDSWNDLTSPCLPEKPWQQYPFTPFVTMLSAYGTMMMDSFSMAYYEKKNKSKLSNHNHNHNHNLVDEPKVVITNGDDQNVVPNVSKEITKGHCNHSKIMQVVGDLEKSKLLKDRVVAQVLELGIVVHSVVIGLSMGASDNPCTIRPLIAAMCFHQLFEGMGLGGCILQAEYGFKIKATMVFFFSVTTPFGIVLGLLLQNVYNENSPIALIVVGVLNAISAGLLIYMAMVDLLAADFKGPKLQANMKLQLLCYLVALLGTGIMSLMAKWA